MAGTRIFVSLSGGFSLVMPYLKVGPIIALVSVAATVILGFINGFAMLLSPRLFLKLPGWLRAQGALSERHYGSGFGAIQLRIVGAAIIGFILWVAYLAFFQQR
jgi:hypothetical protein